MRHRAWLALVTTGLVGCASASHDQGNGQADAGSDPGHDASTADAAGGHDAPSAADASVDAAPSCATPFTGVLATWTFTGEAGSQTATAGTTTTSVTVGDVTRAAGLTAVSGSNAINASGWSTAATRDPDLYFTLTLEPPHGCTLTLTGIAIDTKASGTGPTSAEVATSDDGFTQAATVTINAATTPTLAVSDATGVVELRVYGFAASSTSGTFRLQNTLTVSGALE